MWMKMRFMIRYTTAACLLLAYWAGSTAFARQNDDSQQPDLTDPGFIGSGIATTFSVTKDFQYYAIAERSNFHLSTYKMDNGGLQLTYWAFGKDVPVTNFLFSEKGDKLAGAAFEGDMVKIYDRASGRVIRELKLDGKSIFALSNMFLGDTKIAAGCADGSIVVWDVESGKLLKDFNFKSGPIRTLAVDQDGSQIFFNLEKDKGVGVTDLHLHNEAEASGPSFTKLNWDRECEEPRSGKLFKQWYIVSCNDKTARLFNAETRELVKIFDRELPGLTFAFNDNDRLVIGGFDAVTEVWNLKTMELIDTLHFRHVRHPIVGVAISPNGTKVAICARDMVKIWTLHPERKPDQRSSECSADASAGACRSSTS